MEEEEEDIQPEKAIIEATEGPYKNKKVEVMFNPADINIIYSADVEGNKKTKTGEPDPFFDKVKQEDFTLKLVFDTYERHENYNDLKPGTDVRTITKKITQLMKPTLEGTNNKKKPPICTFSWGSFQYKGIITKIDQKFILFLPNGRPVRVEMTVTFKSILSQEQFEKNNGFGACRKAWTVKSGDRLDLIAAAELKDASLWRKIAHENNIEDPFKFPKDDDIGKRILIPD